jgi:asparagine synthase (glutamine-hydrolysing)
VCGICGEVRFDGVTADTTSALRARGPDGSGRWSDGWVTLGHRRLSIIDPSDKGAQPMVDAERGVEHLVGMFAVAVVDQRRRRLVLARDRLGIKPLYLAEFRGGLRFALTLPALLRRRLRHPHRHGYRPGRAAPLPVVALHRARATNDPARCA